MADKCTATTGCTGTIVDGFCDTCGMQPSTVSRTVQKKEPVKSAPLAAAQAAASGLCGQNGCTGTVVDGFCDTCGLAPAVNANPASSASHRTGSTSLSGRTSHNGSRRSSKQTHLSQSRKLGLGLIQVPEIPKSDPLKSLMKEAKVPPHKRFCTGTNPKDGSACDTPLTKERCTSCKHMHDYAGKPREKCAKCGGKTLELVEREKGFCNVCGTPYDFRPKLKPGDMVAGQYRVEGCIAFGGMGWIYLALDVTLNRYVVLKGLVNSSDPALAKAAVAERQFLAEVKHANIVGVYTCVSDTRQVDNKTETQAYTVMELVGGRTLKSLRKERGPLPVAEVLAYMHPTLVAFAYMHSIGLIYNDFKPDNVMTEDGDIKVIDLGGVCRANQTDGDIYSTVGYAPPELADQGPSVASDLYTIGRTIAVLVAEFPFQSSKFRHRLPTPQEEPTFAKYDSFYRFLMKACHENPSMRFQSADEMAEQLVGVMREVVALDTGTSRPGESRVFGPDTLGMRTLDSVTVDVLDLESFPRLKMNPDDPATAYIMSNLGSGDPTKQTPVLTAALEQFPDSIEAHLAMARNQVRLGHYDVAEKHLAHVEGVDAFDWRVIWYRGMALVAQKAYGEASAAFETCINEVPGELAPKLAMAIALELSGNIEKAVYWYQVVARTDVNYATAVFGLARSLAASGKREEAVGSLSLIPQTSSLYGEAQKAIARALIRQKPSSPGAQELAKAAQTVEALMLEGIERFTLVRDIFATALGLLSGGQIQAAPQVKLMGHGLAEEEVRLGLEAAYRNLARLSNDDEEKIRLVDLANEVRPRTLV